MNVEELLALSEQYITLSRENSLHDMYGAASANAAIAQAAAATAQAMVLAQMTSASKNVTTGETARWLRVDTGN